MAGLQRFSPTAPSFLVNNCILIRGSENVQCSIIISPIFRGVIVNKPPACLHKNRKIIWKLKTSNISLMERQAWLMVQLSLCRNIRRFNKKLWAGNILPTDWRLCAGAGICRCGDRLWSAVDLGTSLYTGPGLAPRTHGRILVRMQASIFDIILYLTLLDYWLKRLIN